MTIILGPGEMWWHPLPAEGETVPDYPPMLLGRFREMEFDGDAVDEIGDLPDSG